MKKSSKPKWSKGLTKSELLHLAEVSDSGRPSLRSLKSNLAHQQLAGVRCLECEYIANKVGVRLTNDEASKS